MLFGFQKTHRSWHEGISQRIVVNYQIIVAISNSKKKQNIMLNLIHVQGYSEAPAARAEPHKKGNTLIDFPMVIMANGIARGRVRTTAAAATE